MAYKCATDIWVLILYPDSLMNSSTHIFDKIKLLHGKNYQQTGNKGNIPKHNKNHIWQIHCQHHTQWAKTINFPLNIGDKTVMSTFTTLIQHSTGSPSQSNQTRRNKRHPNWKGRSKTVSICRWHDIVQYIKNPKDSTKKLLELRNEFSKVAGYKIYIQKSVAFLWQ